MMKQIALAIFAVVTALTATTSFAGRYELIQGEGIKVCEAYQRNFEFFNNATPMACERQYSPKIKGFSSPAWQRLELKKYFNLYKKAELFRQQAYGNLSRADIQTILDHLQEAAQHLKPELFFGRFDLDGKGSVVNVLAIREMSCGPHDTSERTRLYVLNNSLTDLDYSHQKSWGGMSENATIELYRGKPYIEAYNPDDGWGNLFTKSGRFYVYRELSPKEKVQGYYRNFRLKSICEFQYTPSAENKK